MRFYFNGLSLVVLAVVYSILVVVVAFSLYKCRRNQRLLLIVVPMSILLLVAPIAEEVWIAWSFKRSCERDAGMRISRTADVDGFFNATVETHAGPPTSQAIKIFEEKGFEFYEMTMRDKRGEDKKIVHLQKVNGKWTVHVQDRPSARYHYLWPDINRRVGHKIHKNSEIVVDSSTDEVLASFIRYGRTAPWYFIALDVPGMACPPWSRIEGRKPGALYNTVLIPAKKR